MTTDLFRYAHDPNFSPAKIPQTDHIIQLQNAKFEQQAHLFMHQCIGSAFFCISKTRDGAMALPSELVLLNRPGEKLNSEVVCGLSPSKLPRGPSCMSCSESSLVMKWGEGCGSDCVLSLC